MGSTVNALSRYAEDQKKLNQRITQVVHKNLQDIAEKQLASFEMAMQTVNESQAECFQSIRKAQVSLDQQIAPFHESMRIAERERNEIFARVAREAQSNLANIVVRRIK